MLSERLRRRVSELKLSCNTAMTFELDPKGIKLIENIFLQSATLPAYAVQAFEQQLQPLKGAICTADGAFRSNPDGEQVRSAPSKTDGGTLRGLRHLPRFMNGGLSQMTAGKLSTTPESPSFLPQRAVEH